MSGSSGRLAYRPLHVPRADGEVLIDPPLADCHWSIEQNLQRAGHRDVALGGRSLDELSRAAREHLWQTALKHTGDYAPADRQLSESPPERIYLVGHQPELFHPGVWLKNFVLDRLAQRDGAAAIHVLIDNDVVTEATIPVLDGTPASPRVEQIALDRRSDPTPWEERAIADASMFAGAAGRIAEVISPLVERPLIGPMWSDVGSLCSSGANYGQTLARARHRLEMRWGLQTLEAPLSAICDSDSFRWFVAIMLSRLPQLHRAHNDTLAEYRRTHRLRSNSHPVPNLARNDNQFETPFWIWKTSHPRRRKLFAELTDDSVLLSEGENLSHELSRPSGQDLGPCVEQLQQLEIAGVKIRPRALMTTMYLRLFLSDYFIHGIGGAKYDQITDCLIEDIFGIVPPAHMIVSGTRLLPIACPATTRSDVEKLRRELREVKFHPERFLDGVSSTDDARQASALVAQKQALVQVNSDVNARDRHQALARINGELQKHVSSQRDALLRQISQGELDVRAAEILSRREFPFCIYPESTLRPWLLDAGADAS